MWRTLPPVKLQLVELPFLDFLTQCHFEKLSTPFRLSFFTINEWTVQNKRRTDGDLMVEGKGETERERERERRNKETSDGVDET